MEIIETNITTNLVDKFKPQLQVVGPTIYYTWLESGLLNQIATGTSDLDGSNLTKNGITTTATDKDYPQFQVVDSKIYYTWMESDPYHYHIGTGSSNLDGSNFIVTNVTTTEVDNYRPQLQVVGPTIYYTWEEVDGNDYIQIATGTSDLDGSNFTRKSITTSSFHKSNIQFKVVGSTIYYVWQELDSTYTYWQIATGTSDLDGSNFTRTNLTTGTSSKYFPQLQVVGSTIYYTWQGNDGTYDQIVIGTSDLDGSNFIETNLTTSASSKYNPQFQVLGLTIYYTWQEYDGTYQQTATGTSDLHGSNFIETGKTTGAFEKSLPQFQVVGSAIENSTIYYTWEENKGYGQIATGRMILPPIPVNTIIGTNITTSSYNKYYPQLQVEGSTIYYMWSESDGLVYQIAIGTSDLNGSNFNRTNITVTSYDKLFPQLQVVGSTIYYIWLELDGSSSTYQIATATSDLDGSNFNSPNITTGNTKNSPQLQVVGSTIYYTWSEFDGSNYQIAIATSDLDGLNFARRNITTSASDKDSPQLQVVGSTIYYTWYEFVGINYRIATGTSNLDGSNFIETTSSTPTTLEKYNPQLQVVGSTIYYTWYEFDGTYYQIATGTSNLDGTNFTETTSITPTTLGREIPQLQVVGSTIYYTWLEYDGANYQIATGTSNLDGSNFIQMDITKSPFNKSDPQFQMVDSTIYYVWGESGSDQIAIGEALLFSSCPSTVKYSGDAVTLKATPKDGIGPYYVVFRKNGVDIDPSRLGGLSNPISPAPEYTLITRVYTLDDLDISTALTGTIDFSVYMTDSCPTGAQTCTETCTITIGCLAPVCNFTVT